ncbi:T9SS type A sorting domain-containing protein [Marivirga salinae]|uniref:T9SS type A sorting domain-containing protein n=1 Tax=Marivirga salinarum TaxID=3059078 RepID=A0AA51NDC2_9BACT|nr:T9SS type A sorting domain-containing protein [Marivirga sp. BDSF4-3]WMN11501.1 T9SS type A sorting domain-containing protein [Marivirga sp. BDSF4-3]
MIRQVVFLAIGIFTHISAISQVLDLPANPDFKSPFFEVNQQMQHSFPIDPRQAEYQQLDSIVRYGYDEEVEKWNKPLHKLSISYDSNYNDTLILQSVWDKSSNEWLDLTKEIKEYNETNHIKIREFHVIGRTGNRIQYAYNVNNKLIEKTESFFKSGEWHYKQRNVYTYSSENLLVSDSVYRYNFLENREWLNIGITTFYYDDAGQLLHDSTYIKPWLQGNNIGDWRPFSSTSHQYNESQNSEEITFLTWEILPGSFIPSSREFIQYHNEAGDISARINFEWNKNQNVWDSINAVQYSYSDEDELVEYRRQIWDTNPSTVVELLNFDYSVSNDEMLLPSSTLNSYPQSIFHHKILSIESGRLKLNSNQTEKFGVAKFYYSTHEREVVTKIEGSQYGDPLRVYPNPASEFISVNFKATFQDANVTLYNINGTKMLSEPIKNNEKIIINTLKKGMYFYCLEFGNQEYVGKLIVK